MEYGMVVIVFLADSTLMLQGVGSTCANILLVMHDIIGWGHDFLILTCEPTRGA